jgi:hypothetical protein
MRPTILATIPLLAMLAAPAATAQVNAQIRVGIPIGRHEVVINYRPGPAMREVNVREYDRRTFGDWARGRDYRRWQPVTLYFYAGRYYERPFRYARPIVVFRYRDRYFFPPRDAGWERQHGRDRDWGRQDDRDRDDRYNDRGDRNQGPPVVPPTRGGRARP